MKIRTDDAAQVGLHVFERAGLGVAPFRLIGMESKVGPIRMADGSEVGAPGQPMGSCDYCGTGIRDCYEIRSADGRKFVVGCDCVVKTGDNGLIKAYKNNPQKRAADRAKREAKDKANRAEVARLLAEQGDKLAAKQLQKWDGTMEDYRTYLVRVLPKCGASGTARYLKMMRAQVAA